MRSIKTYFQSWRKNSNKLNLNFNVFYLMRLIAKGYFRNFMTIFTDFVLPIIIMSVLYNVLGKIAISTLVPGIILSPIVSSSLISFTIGIVEWKKSVFMKKIKISQISATQFFLAFLFFYFLISSLTFMIGLTNTIVLEQIGVEELKGTTDHLKNVKWEYGWLGICLLILSCLTLGFVIAFFMKTINAVFTVCLAIFLAQAFLIGYYLPIYAIDKKPMQIASWILPQYAPSRIFQVAWYQELEFEIDVFKHSVNNNLITTINKIDYLKDWKVYDFYEDKYENVNFDNSYWSLILASLGWIGVNVGVVALLNKYKKFD